MKRVFASLANGTICIFSRKSISSPQESNIGDAKILPEACSLKCKDAQYQAEAEDWNEPLILTLSETIKAASIKCMAFVGSGRLWCGCGNSIVVVDVVNMKVLTTIPIFAKRAQLVNELVSNGIRVWGIGRQLANVMEWDAETYELKCVFDCSRVDPTGSNVIGDMSSVEDLALPAGTTTRKETKSPSASPQNLEEKEEVDPLESSTSSLTSGSPTESVFVVSNEPENPSKTANAAYNPRLSRQTLKTFRRPRTRVYNITQQEGKSIFSPQPEFDAVKKAKIRSILRQQGATRVTSLLLVHNTLWIARGMGDVVVVDINENGDHGVAIARFATEDSSKYGNRSNHKLCLVGSEYVVSSQWLEPLDMSRPRATTDAGQISAGGGPEQPEVTAHQQITVWEAWNYDAIKLYAQKISQMHGLDSEALNEM